MDFDSFIDDIDFSNLKFNIQKNKLSEIQVKTLSKKYIDNETKYNIDKLLFESNAIINMLWKEIYNINDTYSDIEIIPIDNIIFDLKVIFKNTKFNNITLSVKIPAKLYPYTPPNINILSPSFKYSLNYRVSNIDYLKINNWNPTNTLEYTLISIKDIIVNNGVIKDNNCDLEIILDELSKLTNILPNEVYNEPLKINFNEPLKLNLNQVKNNLPNKGIGYGSGYSTDTSKNSVWDIKEYIKNNNL